MLHYRMWLLSVLLVGTAAAIGCDAKTSPPRPPFPPSGVWDTALFGEEGGRSPIVTSHVWMGDEVVFLIVPGFKRAGGGGGAGTSDELRLHGDMTLPDGTTQLAYEAKTVNGVVERVTIAGKSFDLMDGRTFFLSLNGQVEVKQLDHDTRGLTPQPKHNSREFETFLRGIPEWQELMPSSKDPGAGTGNRTGARGRAHD